MIKNINSLKSGISWASSRSVPGELVLTDRVREEDFQTFFKNSVPPIQALSFSEMVRSF